MTDRRHAVLMDIDGTLVDSNYLHVDAWTRAFRDVGEHVEAWRVHRRIGMDGGRLVYELLGADHPRAEEASDLHARHYAERADDLAALPGARDLVRTLSARGLVVVLATSAPQDELTHLRALLRLEDSVDVVTSSEDADDAKPAPDIVHVALERAGTDPDHAVMVGDAIWDMQSATAAGVRPVGLLTGGISSGELRQAGAVEVWDGPQHLLDELASSIVGGATPD